MGVNDDNGMEDILIGTVICLASSTLSNVGLLLMKLAVTDDHVFESTRIRATSLDQPESLGHSISLTRQASFEVLQKTSNTKWFTGFGVYFSGQLLNLVSLSFLPEVLWAVVSLFSLVSNLIFSRLLLGEPICLHDYFYTFMIICGSALVVYAHSSGSDQGDASVDAWTLRDILHHFTHVPFLAFLMFLVVLLISCTVWGIHSIVSGERVHAIAWSIVSATFGSTTTLLGKCCSYLVASVYSSADGISSSLVFSSIYTYLILVLFLLSAILSFVTLNMALAAGEAMVVVPWLMVSNTLLTILGGIFYFQEFSSFESVSSTIQFVFGVLLTIAGAIMLQESRKGKVSSSKREEDFVLLPKKDQKVGSYGT